MRLLVITQCVDSEDPVLGFFHGWLDGFARRLESMVVLGLGVGRYRLPDNVTVLSLGKDEGISRGRYVIRLLRHAWSRRGEYDAVLVHMNQVYVLLAGWLWWLLRKPVVLWYAHGSVSPSLRVAEKLAARVVTSTEGGFRIESAKKRIVGQGIDTARFRPGEPSNSASTDSVPTLVSVGRISPVKDYETLIRALGALNRRATKLQAELIGDPALPEDRDYVDELKSLAETEGIGLPGGAIELRWVPGIANREVVSVLQRADLFVNTSSTGSLDKAIVEAMATETPILTSNEAAGEILGSLSDECMFPTGDFEALATRIEHVVQMDRVGRERLGKALRQIVVRDHNVDSLISRVIAVAAETLG